MVSLRLCWHHFDRPARLFPGAEPAPDMRNRFETHALRRLRRERRTQTAGTEKHKFLVLGEYRFVIRASRIDPKLQHSARTMKGARHLSIAFQLSDVANIDQHGVGTARERDGLINRQGLDLALRSLAQGLVARCNGLWHRVTPWRSPMLAEPRSALKRREECLQSMQAIRWPAHPARPRHQALRPFPSRR